VEHLSGHALSRACYLARIHGHRSTPLPALSAQIPASGEKQRSAYAQAKRSQSLRINLRHGLRARVFTGLGMFSAAFALDGFLRPSGLLMEGPPALSCG